MKKNFVSLGLSKINRMKENKNIHFMNQGKIFKFKNANYLPSISS